MVAGPTQSGGTNQIINYIIKPRIVDGKLKGVAIMSVNFHYIVRDLSVHNYFTTIADVLLLDQKQIIMRKKSTMYYDVPFFSEQQGQRPCVSMVDRQKITQQVGSHIS